MFQKNSLIVVRFQAYLFQNFKVDFKVHVAVSDLPWFFLHFVIVVFTYHTHLAFLKRINSRLSVRKLLPT